MENKNHAIKKYVTVYQVTRSFGGHEEGGWYFDRFEPVETIEVKGNRYDKMDNKMRKIICRLEDKYRNKAYGDISSVLGGGEYSVYGESSKHKHELLDMIYE